MTDKRERTRVSQVDWWMDEARGESMGRNEERQGQVPAKVGKGVMIGWWWVGDGGLPVGCRLQFRHGNH